MKTLAQPSLEESLKALFGYNSFRENQKEIVQALIEKRDVLAILPTGAGKSICYQLPALLMEGTALVISPLISLMQDQVFALNKSGLSAAFLNSSLLPEEISFLMQNLGSYKLLYVAPERFSDALFVEKLQKIPISLFAIDEAHCISQWGHSFRPEYRQLSFLKKNFPSSPLIALTATATRDVEKDILSQLGMKDPFLVKASFDRPNLTLRIYRRKNASDQIRTFLEKHPNQSGILYSSTRNGVDEMYEELKQGGFSVGRYHAGLSEEERRSQQEAFLYGKTLVMVATVAFGMGIHKPDIRFILHLDMPRSIEQYYQEIGRAGRDGLPAECLMLYSPKEKQIYDSFAEKIENGELRREVLRKTDRMIALCTTSSCRRVPLLGYFGEEYTKVPCLLCDHCLDDVEMVDETVSAQKILSCVYRLKFQSGIKHVIDVLRGLKTQPIFAKEHDRLSTYGIMQEVSESKLFFLIYRLIEMKFLETEENGERALRWTASAPSVIRGESKVLIPKQIRQKRSRHEEEGVHDRALFDALSKLRKSLAEKNKVPAFVVFGDKTLIEFATIYPQTMEEMMDINGVGPVKWAKYGPLFLEVIQRHLSSSEKKS